MRGFDEIPHEEAAGVGFAAPECVGTCFSRLRSELLDATPDAICHELQDYCESPALVDFCTLHGVNGATFRWNPHLQCKRLAVFRKHPHGKLYQHFWQAYHDHPTLNLALAFHGTGEANVNKILHYGLDPHYRRTQAFGKGEYFAKEPGLAATYRHEGHCLLVFLLLLPKDHEKIYSQKDRDIIVVPELSHQLPLGVIRFTNVDNAKIQHSQEMRLHQRALKHAAVEADVRVTQAKLMVTLAELLQQGQYEQAACELHQATRYHQLAGPHQQRLAGLLEEAIPHEATRQELFPQLAKVKPASKKCLEADKEKEPSIEELEAEAHEAWRAFVQMKMDPNRNILKQVPSQTATATATTPTCAQQLFLQHSTPGAMLLLDH